MPKLRCSAQSCVHNASEYCCRGAIEVAGASAGHSEETCCSNFYQNVGNMSNAVGQEPTEFMNVQCEAQNCTHNKGCQCQADYIDVSGHGACESDQTCCSSFKPQ